MADQMVLTTQQWLNSTYGNKTGFGSVQETGNTGWDTINALIRALQIELGITATAKQFRFWNTVSIQVSLAKRHYSNFWLRQCSWNYSRSLVVQGISSRIRWHHS